VDVFQNNSVIKVIVELPGVVKSDIKLDATEENLTISVDSSSKKYYKEIELQERINPKEAKSTYKNGILEVNLPKEKGRRSKGYSLKID
jgi:HSP20 family protein